MSGNAFLKLDKVEGESHHKGHEKEIDILDINWNLAQLGSGHYGGGSGTGKVDFHDISIVKRFDVSSPNLMGWCASGQPIGTGIITVRKAAGHEGGEPLAFLKIKLTDVLVSHMSPSGIGSGDGMEHVTLNFSKVHMTYTAQNADGSKGKAVEFGWDVKQNAKF